MHESLAAPGVRQRTFRPAADPLLDAAAFYDGGDGTDPTSPIVCMQHGGSSSKSGADVLDAARVFVARGCRVLALDGPVHGARGQDGETDLVTRERFLNLWRQAPGHIESHVNRWIDLLRETHEAWPDAHLLWYGVSMGTAYGLPVLAQAPRIRRAALGMWGACFPQSQRLLGDAGRVGCPVLFQQKWDDELFTRQGQLDLFDALGTRDKRLVIYPGTHTRVVGEQLDDLVRFLCNEPGPGG
ncbi:MAG: CocE/NonD family hydrolase [Acidovorax sp.]|uniref:alpha/beta hydrolase n=1 Tax=Acidovorax sp. TaxID=1872122 RepID=UPI0039E515F5